MSRSIVVSPFDWRRFEALRRSLDASDEARTAALLARGAAWTESGAGERLTALEARRLPLPGLELRLRLAVAPDRAAAPAAKWLATLDPSDAESFLVDASATAAPEELPVSAAALVELLAGEHPHGDTADAAVGWHPPAVLADVLGGVEPGVRALDPQTVRNAAAALQRLATDARVAPEPDATDDGSRPAADLARTARSVLRDLARLFTRAAAEGWGLRLVV